MSGEQGGWLGTAEQLRAVLVRSAEGITVQDLKGRVRFANEAAARAMGFDDPQQVVDTPQAELMARFELLDAEGRPLAERNLPSRQAARGGVAGETLVRFRIRATGEERWSLVRPTLVRDERGAPQFIVSSFHDVTALKASERQLSLLANAGSILGRSVDYQETLNELAQYLVRELADWCVVDVVEPESGVRRLAVAHVDQAKVQLAEEIQRRYPPTDQEGGVVAQVLRSGEPFLLPHVSDEQLMAAARDEEHAGYLRELGLRSILMLPLTTRERVLGVITLVRSDPSRAFGEDDLPITRELAARAAIAIDNARLLHGATEAVRLRDDFLAMASHDMRTPLAAILGYLQLARRKLAAMAASGAEADKLADYLESAEGTANRLTDLVADLMDVTLLRSGQPLPLDTAPVHLGELAARIVEQHRRLDPSRAFDLEVEAGPPEIRGDARRLERVMDNLLANAVKFSPAGAPIEVAVGVADGFATVSVTDHGLGIPAEDLPGIFERFRRASNVTGVRGTGIGLAGSREIVRQLGGEIEVASRLGEGSTFTVRLPIPVAG